MDDTTFADTERRMQSEILGERLATALDQATFADQSEARDAARYAQRIRFAMKRVDDLRASCRQRASFFEAGRLDVALTILEGHVFRAADFIDAIARRQRSELGRVNSRIAGQVEAIFTQIEREERAA